MSIKKVFKDIYEAIRDPERGLYERVYIIFSIISELAVTIALIGDILTGENTAEIAVLIGTLILVPAAVLVGFYKGKMETAIRFMVICLVFVILPALFFFGGGLKGGGVLWLIFAFIYVGLVLTGKWRVVILTVLVFMSIAFYTIDYYNPELSYVHSRSMFYMDSLISIILVGMVSFVMTWFQSRLFEEENERAKKEKERAEDLTRSQNRFFSSMSHEIRTPINSILGLNELILRDPDTSDEIVKDASGIQGSGKMLLALINDILDFSKIEAGSMDIVPVDYKVGDMMSEIVNMVWLRAHDKGLKFEVNIDPKVPTVLYGDEVRIKQVIVNLLNNAVKYTAEGSVELHIECEEADDDNVMLIITVSDTGMGIKKEALPYLFDAFKRVDEEKNRHIEGTGLGLSIVKQLVELMDGNVTVNSVYGEGSMFTVEIKQGVSDRSMIGELNIHNQVFAKREAYESSFTAPDARILIVDDNEMNLEVECKLLADTHMTIDKALSGREALELSLKNRYDAILMDHLMPKMDGIECLELLRNQSGGLNRTTPVIVLTANAGSSNRDLYNRSGFDGYLVKPVSGEALESLLIKYIDKDKLIPGNKLLSMREDISTASGYTGKLPVIITTTSVCDLPTYVIKKLNLPMLPILIYTDEGVFKDGVQMDSDELIRYIEAGGNAISRSANEAAYTEFFANALRKAHHLIHISVTSSMSNDYKMASEAAKAFDNVTVINSGTLSSSMGILTMIACKLAQQNIPLQEIIDELESMKTRLRCSFVVDTTEFMAKKGFISPFVHKAAMSLNLHPCISFKDDKSIVGPVWMGSTQRAYKKYIKKAFPVDIIPDSDVVFITYADIPVDILMKIKEEISKYAYFEHVIFKQASAAISSNCGPGTFGVLYFVKSNKSYNIGSYFEDENYLPVDDADDDSWHDFVTPADAPVPIESEENLKWYDLIPGINGTVALANSGSEETLNSVIKLFYDSIPEKSKEIQEYYESENWQDYAIKVHALKSSAKLIGAMSLANDAQLLENAGKETNVEYIKAHHDGFMSDYIKYKDLMAEIFADDSEENSDDNNRPVADDYLMKSIYEGLKEAADNMDCDAIESMLNELKEYKIPDSEKERFFAICEKAGNFDYDGIKELLENN